MGWRVGVDIGGTFTDVALIEEETSRIGIAKVPTTPQDFAQGVTAGLHQGLARYSIEPAAVSLLSHARTVVTNALLEKKGARTGFVTTRGFRDMLELRRSSRADVYDLFQDPPAILVPRRWRYEITERIDAQGNVVIPLEETDIDAVIAGIRDVGLDTVAVSCLFSFLNDAHERRVGERNVMAASQGTSAVVTFGGVDPRSGERYVSYESLKGGFGARPGKDGINAVASTTSNMMNTPVEMLEMAFPLRVEEYSLIPDSGGAGSWRGGLGARRVWRVLGEWVPPGGSAGASALRRDHESPAIIAAVFSPIMIVGA